MPPRFGNIFMVGTTTALIEDFLPEKKIIKKLLRLIKILKINQKLFFYPNVAGILSPKV